MAVGFEEKGRQFIETDTGSKAGKEAERKIWEATKKAFSNRNCIAYWGYPIFSKTGESRKEPDIFIVDKELGLIVIEVQSISINQITKVDGHLWQYQDFYVPNGNPYQQAENQLYAILGYCDKEPEIRRKVRGRSLVSLPLITEKQWQEKRFDILPNCPPIIFQDQLGEKTLIKVIENTPPVQTGKNLDETEWETLLSVIGGGNIHRKPQIEVTVIGQSEKTRSSIINQLYQRLYELDIQQVHIGTEIPPGAQRIRGIAGSGKTVLLCQKAANMYLKHPDWDIALVFFTRSLYDQITNLVDKWIRHYSNGEIGYKDNPEAKNKLKILHAWGARNREGFYRTICEKHNKSPLTVQDTDYRQPNEGLADICKSLLEKTTIEPMFDAVLIDEGQDLVVDPSELKYQDKQVIYWLAYQSLRPCDSEHPEQRRLIWAYDEAQRLDSKTIPSAPNIFGKSFQRFVTGNHKGNIKKSEVMRRCYRTPAPILTAAHAIGMGFLRPEGMLSGITNKEEWDKIGYEVEGDFRKKDSLITLHRPPMNSPNPICELWGETVIRVEIYNTRNEELEALVKNIKYNLEVDGLKKSRQILVIVLGDYEARSLENDVAQFLMTKEIKIFIPSATRPNQLNPQYPDNDPDSFWYEDAVTVSRITRAKGNEADMVYVVGFDNVAKNADDVNARNQLFVALTRARGWVNLTGIGSYPMYDEMQKVIESGNTFQFYNKPSQNDISHEDTDDEN